jgi:undecaprenyl-phosphate 4-deoxy-4-formamido-L-arabinose transferase
LQQVRARPRYVVQTILEQTPGQEPIAPTSLEKRTVSR